MWTDRQCSCTLAPALALQSSKPCPRPSSRHRFAEPSYIFVCVRKTDRLLL